MMYEIEVVIVGQGLNYHKTIKTEILDFTYENNQYKIEVDSDKLFLKRMNMFKRLFHRLRGKVQQHYYYFIKDSTVMPQKDGTQQVEKGQVIYHGSHRSSEAPASMIYIVDKTRVVGGAFAEIFGRPISSKTIMYLLIIGIVGIVFYLFVTGGIKIPGVIL